MPLLKMSVKHGQTWDIARANFERGITEASTKFAIWIHRVEWSDDRTSAKLFGPGFVVEIRVDPQDVHATGDLPLFANLFEAPLKAFLQQTFHKQIPH
jgi:hypothetical protein